MIFYPLMKNPLFGSSDLLILSCFTNSRCNSRCSAVRSGHIKTCLNCSDSRNFFALLKIQLNWWQRFWQVEFSETYLWALSCRRQTLVSPQDHKTHFRLLSYLLARFFMLARFFRKSKNQHVSAPVFFSYDILDDRHWLIKLPLSMVNCLWTTSLYDFNWVWTVSPTDETTVSLNPVNWVFLSATNCSCRPMTCSCFTIESDLSS